MNNDRRDFIVNVIFFGGFWLVMLSLVVAIIIIES